MKKVRNAAEILLPGLQLIAGGKNPAFLSATRVLRKSIACQVPHAPFGERQVLTFLGLHKIKSLMAIVDSISSRRQRYRQKKLQ